jgi:phospholipid/cholesterol/gamma-HCH transport system substrate-binding protein
MNRQITETIVGGIVLFVAAYFFIMAYNKSGSKSVIDGYVVQADFSDVTGITIGSDVRVSGVKIGTVNFIKLNHENYQAEVGLLIGGNLAIPQDTSASIVGESLLGGKFVALEIGGAEAMLKGGDKIEYTQSSVSLEQLLGKFVFSGGGVEASEKKSDDESTENIDLKLP